MESVELGAPAALRNRLLLALYRADPGVLGQVRPLSLLNGDTVFEEGAVPHAVIFPEGALLSSLAAMADGRTVEVASLGQDDAVGLLSCLTSEPETCRTVVRISGPARAIPAPLLRAAADENEGLRRLLLRMVRKAAVRAEQELACGAVHDVAARLAKWLLLTCARTGETRLPLTQDDMAVILGVQRTTLNASALQMKASGALRYSRGVVQVLDPERLEAHACECYAHALRDFEPDDVARSRRFA
ncbi:Crp/Fnr family transcriptional regulator [Brevundimonas sp.]|uniref:Crp/Fnr family transcriptional regulator n=1 Tax=Brevundimonas sp. TaxID=1871086 RepID=UPI002D6888AC|nr:Crp/Fnr family transcriptional regulator [Brevundimonas sp.]HYC67099.1 Crp/Fnr family transcriptional regulator [Brevundimonas sp.]